MIFEMMACALKNYMAKGESMKKLKQILERISTGIKNNLVFMVFFPVITRWPLSI